MAPPRLRAASTTEGVSSLSLLSLGEGPNGGLHFRPCSSNPWRPAQGNAAKGSFSWQVPDAGLRARRRAHVEGGTQAAEYFQLSSDVNTLRESVPPEFQLLAGESLSVSFLPRRLPQTHLQREQQDPRAVVTRTMPSTSQGRTSCSSPFPPPSYPPIRLLPPPRSRRKAPPTIHTHHPCCDRGRCS